MNCPKCRNKMTEENLDSFFIKKGIPIYITNNGLKINKYLYFECKECQNRFNPSLFDNYGYCYIYFPNRNTIYNYFNEEWHKVDTKGIKEKVIFT